MKKISVSILLSAILTFASCKKYLDAKTDLSLSTLSTSEDLQSLLDHYSYVNNQDPNSAEINADNYYMKDNINYFSTQDLNQYIWATENIYTKPPNDWSNIYDVVYRANTVLDNVDKVEFNPVNKQENYNNIKGQALFLRARCFLEASNIWSLVYDSSTADKTPGIPLRLTSDFNQKTTRASQKQTYQQIIDDLKAAAELLPKTPLHVFRASRPAALALLARTYLFAGDYNNTLRYADSSLQIKNTLFNYNQADTTSQICFPLFNTEVIFEAGYPNSIGLYFGKVDSNLVKLYEAGDLRKSTFIRPNGDGTYSFKSGYASAQGYLFDGIANDEVYLMRAESNARLGNTNQAMNDINTLLKNRYLPGSYSEQSASSPENALSIVMNERRKELYYRNLRWMDIKRINRIAPTISLKRIVNGQIYELTPGSKRFANPIPDDIIQLSGIQQNTY